MILRKIDETPGCSLFQLTNRLSSSHSDIVLAIVMDDVVGELRLVKYNNPNNF